VAIGCMRPRGKGIEEMAYKIGIDALAVPPLSLIRKIKEIEKKEICCGCP